MNNAKLTLRSPFVATANTHFRSESVTTRRQMAAQAMTDLPRANSTPLPTKKASRSSKGVSGVITVYGWALDDMGK